MTLTFGSVCSGIEAASTAWHPLGWKTAYVADIEPFPCAVMARRIGAGRPMHMPDPNEIDLPAGYTDADTGKLRAKREAHKNKKGPALTEGEVAALVPLEERADRRANIKALDHVEWGSDVPNFGDFTKVEAGAYPIDLLVGGTPCQAFSVAGARLSLGDARGNLSLEYVRLVHATKSLRWAVWENVPGVLSTADNAFGCFLGGLVGADVALEVPGGGAWPGAGMVSGPLGRAAWRVLDAQHFGVAQRRRRVFVVFCPRASGGDPSAILFERQGMPGDSSASGEAREGTSPGFEAGAGSGGACAELAPTLSARTKGGGGLGTDFDLDGGLVKVAPTLLGGGNSTGGTRPPGSTVDNADSLIPVAFGGGNSAGERSVAAALTTRGGGKLDFESETFVAHTLRAEGFDASEDGTGRGAPLVPVAFTANDHGGDAGDISPTLRSGNHDKSHANGGVVPAVAIPILEAGARTGVSTTDARAGMGVGSDGDPMFTLQAGKQHAVGAASAVRRLTPRECERLQGFPDDYTAILWRGKPAADGPRYKALGNSMAVPVMHWIGSRIAAFEAGTLDGWKWDRLRFAFGAGEVTVTAFSQNQRDEVRIMDKASTLAAEPGMKQQTYLIVGE